MGLELKVEQKQRVYQKQIEQARILQMNAQELAVCIQEAALENPLIELEEMMDVPIEELVKKDVRETDETEAEVSEDTDWRYTGGHQSPEDWWTPQGGKSESLVDMIHQQLLTMSIGEKEKEIVEKLAGALDSRGYLEIPVKKLAKYIPCSVQELRSALEILKSLEPAGIGATDLKECLILQLRRQKDSRLAVTLVKNYLEDLPKHRISAIAKELGENEDAVKDAFARIRTLNPKPGSIFGEGTTVLYVIPDIIVSEEHGEYTAALNEAVYRKLRLNESYVKLKDSEESEVREYIIQKQAQAGWLKTCIEQRSHTLQRIADILIDFQRTFLETGKDMKPLRQKDVAQIMEVHESTVSRAVKGKYLQCGRGVYALSDFMPKGMEEVSSDSVKQMLKKIIQNEDKKKPLSDQKLVKKLEEENKNFCFIYLGHYCNWEWIASLPYWVPEDILCGQIYHPLYNKAFDRLFLRLRNQFGGECISMKETLRRIIELKRAKQKTIIGFISDQAPKWNSIHHWTDFFHRETPVFIGTEKIGKQVDALIYYADVKRIKRGYYHCEFKQLTDNAKAVPDFQLTDMYIHNLERMISAVPQYWLWSHKRWKRTKEEWIRRQQEEKEKK